MLGKLLGMFVLMLTNFLAALYLETRLAANSGAEFIVIILGIILAIGVLYGLFARTNWSWPLSTIFFSASLGNLSLLYYYGNRAGILVLLIYLAAVFFGFIGLMISLLSIGSRAESAEAADSVKPYHEEREEIPPGTSYVWPKAKRAKKAKKSRKAAGRKRAGKRRKR
jgi:hypothetical protein